jgi:hypothetical protein
MLRRFTVFSKVVRDMKSRVLTLSLLIMFASATGQAVLRVDKSVVVIGDQIRATVHTPGIAVSDWQQKESIWPDSLTGIDIVQSPDWSRVDQLSDSATWVIAVFDTGLVRLPMLRIPVSHSNRSDTLFTRDVPLTVTAFEPDSTGLRPIKFIEREPFRPMYYIRFLPYIIGVVALLAGLFYWWRKRSPRTPEPVTVASEVPPHQWAMKALEELAEARLWQRGEIKDHYTRLTAIFREYLERQFGIRAMEQTSDEILSQLQRQQLDHSLLKDTGDLLEIADLIKFAKADPGIDIHADTIGRVKTFVIATSEVRENNSIDHDTVE